MVNNGEREAICIRSDGLIVEGKLHLQSSTCPRLNPTTLFPKMLFCFTQANLLFVLPILKILWSYNSPDAVAGEEKKAGTLASK